MHKYSLIIIEEKISSPTGNWYWKDNACLFNVYSISVSNVYFSIRFFRKDDKYVLCRKFLAFKYTFFVFLYIRNQSWKLAFNPGFWVHNIHLYLWCQVENTKWILCCRKIVLNVQNLRFRMYKYSLLHFKNRVK